MSKNYLNIFWIYEPPYCKIYLLGSGTIFISSVAGHSSKAEAENTKSARCKICLKEDLIKNLMVITWNVFEYLIETHNSIIFF